MPRPLRIEYENAWYHVMNRGANRKSIYKSNVHRNLFFTLLEETVEQFDVEIHAFCLMSNHYHILIRTPHANLSRAMRHLDGLYTQKFNRQMERDGPLFRGRYQAILVDSDEYLLQVSRYIHLNPIDANICKDPAEFKWSSCRYYFNKNINIGWLNTKFILDKMSGIDPRASYFDYVMEGIDERTKLFYKKKRLSTMYGKESFIKAHLDNLEINYIPAVLTDINKTRCLPTIETILDQVKVHFKISKDDLYKLTYHKKNVGKLVAVYLLRKLGHLTHREIAEIFGIKPRSISSLMNRIKKLIMSDPIFEQNIIEISKKISETEDTR